MDWREIVLIYLVMFIIGCMGGYLLEVLYRRYAAKKWVNPGFMKGPWLPLYGFGLLLMFSVCFIIETNAPATWQFYNPMGDLFWRSGVSGGTWYDLIPLSLMAIGTILLEFVAGIIFVNGFKVRLWDYTNFKGNIKGVICPQFNLIWCVVAVIYYYGINPFIFSFFETLSSFFTVGDSSSLITEFFVIFGIGILYGVMLIDWVNSAGLFHKIVKFTKNNPVALGYEKLREEMKEKKDETVNKLSELVPQAVKAKLAKEEEKSKKTKEKATNWFKKLIYIDPDRDVSADEYDENGRPSKIE